VICHLLVSALVGPRGMALCDLQVFNLNHRALGSAFLSHSSFDNPMMSFKANWSAVAAMTSSAPVLTSSAPQHV
jgi:hypothetical protein